MPKITDHILFNDFGLDTDTANRYKAKGSSEYFLNVLKGEDGAYGELTNLKGNRTITYQLGDAEVYFVAWSCYDPLTRNVYYYIFSLPYDTTGSGDYEFDNRFIRFNEDTEVITTMFYDTHNYFGVDPTIRVKDSFVLGDWLFYNPQTSEPKIIHLEMIYNYTTYPAYDATLLYTQGRKVTYFGGLFVANQAVGYGDDPVNFDDHWDRIGDSYQDATDIEFDSEFRYAFNLIKHIPVYRPICTYATDADKNANNVRGKLFRFSHRYKFFDNSYSRYGAFSDITLPQNDETYNGELVGDLDKFNCIDVSIPLHSSALVKEIDIIFQETGGDWKRAKIINRRDIVLLDQPFYTYRFYNTDSAYDPIDDAAFGEAYDSVPRMANSIEIVNKNILAFGGVTEGFDNLDKNDIDVLLTPEMENITISKEETTLRRNCVLSDITQEWTDTGWITTIDMSWCPNPPPPTIQSTDVLSVRINGQEFKYTITVPDVGSFNAFMLAIETFLIASYPAMGWDWVGNTFITTEHANVSDFSFWGTGAVQSALTKATGFKTGAWHPFCIYYYDEAMRRWDAQTSKEHVDGIVAWSAEGTTVYIPMFGEYSPNDGSTAHKWNINWEVNHLPPAGAKWWRWGYAGNALCTYFVQYIIEDIGDVGVSSATEPINTTWIDISPLQTITNSAELLWNKFPNSAINPYSWTKGDRVRFITEKSSGNNLGATLDGVYDYEILAEDKDTNRIYIQDFGYVLLNIDADTLIEIYTPIKTDAAKQFFEFGELMPIIEDSDGVLVHGCGVVGTQNQDTLLSDPATGVFTAGDVYHILRTPSKPIDTIEGYFHESQWYSDFYPSDDWDKGRFGVETQFNERYLNVVRHSKQYLQDTLINGLSTFFGMDYVELNDVFGNIMRIIEIGDTLKVYQRKKPSSILIGRTEYVDSAGNANIVKTSDRIFGSIRYSSTNYGTEFPESITRNNRYVYGFDIYNGMMWRDSANGIFPISGRYESTDGGGDYKMQTYFKQKAKALLVSGIDGVDVETVWDERHKNLYVIFKDVVTDANNEAIMFHEPSNRWICFTEMDQTPVGGWGQMLELQWAVKQGFSSGIGFVFDEDTWFSLFNVTTPKDERAFTTRQDLTLTLYDPTVRIDCTVIPDVLNIVLTQAPPEIILPFVDVVPQGYAWASTELTAIPFILTCSPATCQLRLIPDWIWVDYTSNIGSHLNIDAVISTGASLSMYPKAVNTGGLLDDYVVFQDMSTLCYDTVHTTMLAASSNPTVRVLSLGGDTNVANGLENVMTMGGTSCVAGSTQVDISFTCDHKDLAPLDGTAFTVFATVDIKDSQYGTSVATYPSGSGNVSTNQIVATSLSITNLSVAVQSGYWVYVYVTTVRIGGGVIPPTDVTTIPAMQNLTLTLYNPDVKITLVSPSTLGETWISTQFGVGNARPFSITASDAVETRVVSFPSWITIVDSGGTDLKGNNDGTWVGGGHNIQNGEVCNIYPTDENIGGELSGVPIVLINEYGDTNHIHVTHQAKAGVVPITLAISSNDTTYLAFKTGVYRQGVLIDGTIQINLSVTFDSPIHDASAYYKVYWYATKNGNFAGRSWYSSTAIDCYDEIEINTTIYLDAIAEDTDTIIIYFAGNYI